MRDRTAFSVALACVLLCAWSHAMYANALIQKQETSLRPKTTPAEDAKDGPARHLLQQRRPNQQHSASSKSSGHSTSHSSTKGRSTHSSSKVARSSSRSAHSRQQASQAKFHSSSKPAASSSQAAQSSTSPASSKSGPEHKPAQSKNIHRAAPSSRPTPNSPFRVAVAAKAPSSSSRRSTPSTVSRAAAPVKTPAGKSPTSSRSHTAAAPSNPPAGKPPPSSRSPTAAAPSNPPPGRLGRSSPSPVKLPASSRAKPAPPARPSPPKAEAVQPRLDISEISAMSEDNKYKILMLMAWNEMTTSTDTTDPLSLWALAGVHGLSWPYDGVRPSNPTEGFCRHSSPDFGPWHRPYLIQFEKGLQKAANSAINRITNRAMRAEYLELAQILRMPYWDWTNPEVPSLLTERQVQVIDAEGRPTTIDNPFHEYRYPQSVGGGRGSTVARDRSWDRAMSSSASTFANEMRSFVASRAWTCTFDGSGRCAGNLELTHNNVHNILGGTRGEMATVGYAGFDPLFWLHHAMIDRCLWLFQNNGGGWEGERSYVPFRALVGDLASLKAFNYTYRDPLNGADLTSAPASGMMGRRGLLAANPNALPNELPAPDAGSELGSPAALAAVRRQLRVWAKGYRGFGWQVQFDHLRKTHGDLTEAVHIHVFLKDVPRRVSSSLEFPDGGFLHPNMLRLRRDYCGSVAGFNDVMARMRNRTFVASVDLTNCLRAAGVNPSVAPKDATNPSKGPERAAVKVSDLKFVAMTANGMDITRKFRFPRASISWSLPVEEIAGSRPVSAAALAQGPQHWGLQPNTVANMAPVSVASPGLASPGGFSLQMGFFEEKENLLLAANSSIAASSSTSA